MNSNVDQNNFWVDQRREFYYNLMEKWLDDNDVLMHLTHIEDKPVVAERFIRTLKNKTYKQMTARRSCFFLLLFRHVLSKDHTKYWSREIGVINYVLKSNPWTHRINDSNGEKILRSFYEKEWLLRN